MRRALLSVSDKTGLVDFARGLAARGFELVSTGGTAAALAAAGLPVTGVSDVTGFPEMMDGRVKTLHPAVHGGILARRAPGRRPGGGGRAHGIGLIDVVVVNLYPFAQAAANPAAAVRRTSIENIDIGGPSMVRAAAKNFRDVLVVVDPADYPAVLAALDAPAARRWRSASTWPAGRSRTPPPTTRRSPQVLDADRATTSRRAGPRRRRRWRRRGWSSTAPRCATCATARTRTSRRPGTPSATADGLGAARRPAGQGAVLHEPARSRRRGAHRRSSSTSRRRSVIKHTNPCGVATGASTADGLRRAPATPTRSRPSAASSA